MQSGPKIVTSCWRTDLPANCAPIGISRGVPRRRSGYRRYAKLEPGKWFSSTGVEEFTRLYHEEILGPLNPEAVVNELQETAGDRIPALLCWESPEPGPQWCHRSLVSVWLWEKLALEVPEFGHEHEGFGWRHPKLHPDVRERLRQIEAAEAWWESLNEEQRTVYAALGHDGRAYLEEKARQS
jgi:hypothetical protein